MKSNKLSLITIVAVLGFVLLGAWGVWAQRAGKTSATPAYVAVNKQAAVSCQFCFTCGGDWGVFAGDNHSPSAPIERGPGCSGALAIRSDTFPQLCCN
jgi:hypothetical protein